MRAISSTQRRIEVSTDSRYLTIGQVRDRFGVSDMWVWRHIRQYGFPKPVQFGGPTSARHWVLAAVEAWERDRVRQSSSSRFPKSEQPRIAGARIARDTVATAADRRSTYESH